MNFEKLKHSNRAALKIIGNSLPVTFGILLLISIITGTIPNSFYQKLFSGNLILDSLIGDLLGSVLIGNPITGYIIGNELLISSVSLFGVTAFLVAWVTVGVIQSPAEAKALGKGFALFRNLCAFFMALVVAIITVSVVGIL